MVDITRYQANSFGGPIEAHPHTLPDPEGREVLVEVSHCGVCHTDLHVHHGGYQIGGGNELRLEDRGVTPPIVLGHEIVGRIVASGADATDLPEGRVAVYPWIGCGTCSACADERDDLCAAGAYLGVFRPGGYASHVMVPDPKYLVDIGDLDPAQAALCGCSGLTTFSALKRLDHLSKDNALLIIGAGGLGQSAIWLARQMGWRDIVASDPSPDKRALAERLGATAVGDLSEMPPADLPGIACTPICGVLDFVGNETTTGAALGAVAKGGTVVIVGLFGGELRYPLPLIPVRALTIVGSFIGHLADFRDYIAFVKRVGPPVVPIEERKMEEAEATLRDLQNGKIQGRAILVS